MKTLSIAITNLYYRFVSRKSEETGWIAYYNNPNLYPENRDNPHLEYSGDLELIREYIPGVRQGN